MFRLLTLTMAACALLAGCGEKPASTSTSKPGTSSTHATKAAKPEELPWMHDYEAALKLARTRKVPLVVDMWAPWCHTCLSMQHTVLTDKVLLEMREQFVWVALDTDKPLNAAVLQKLPVNVWPTFFVVSPKDESVQARLTGGASVAQFKAFLEQGQGGHAALTGSAKAATTPAQALVRQGDQAAVRKDFAAADAAYGKAVALGKLGTRLPEVLVMQIAARYKAKKWKACVQLGIDRMKDAAATRTASSADFASYASACAGRVKDDPSTVAQLRKESLDTVSRVVMDPDSPLSIDDRADGLRILRDLYGEGKPGSEARTYGERVAKQQRALLDKAFDAAPPNVAMMYGWPMCEVYHYLGKAAELEPKLVKLADALPGEYDPPYRLAWIRLKLNKLDGALASANKALGLVYGPRKARVYSLIASIHKAKKDNASERAAREAVVRVYENLPPGHHSAKRLEAARKAVAEMKN